MDHFARKGDELAVAQREKTLHRNFQGYSTRRGADVFAYGMSAISQAGNIYWQNLKELPAYYGAIDRGEAPMARYYTLTADDQIRRVTIMGLMCDFELDFESVSQKTGVVFEEYFKSELASLSDLEQDGLVEIRGRNLTVTDNGRLFIRNIAMRFDAYLPAEKERRFSRTI
jgi:oxygen-independent coproporphyrinogen-3 oxidase